MTGVAATIELALGLLVGVTILTVLAQRIGVAYPLVLVIGGLAMAAAPQIPDVELHPDLVMVLFLPPLLFTASTGTSWQELRRELRPVSSLAVGLVLATATAVAFMAHTLIPQLPWSGAFVLGAILSPTDAVAAGAIAHRLGLPRRVMTLVQGEALVNDASGLVVYQFAVAAVVVGRFSLAQAGARFVYVIAVGVGLGLLVGYLLHKIQRWLDEPMLAILVLVLGAYAAYLPAEALHGSGVLAVVAAGLYVGRKVMPTLAASTRLTATAVLQMVTFLINGLVFILLGMQLSTVTTHIRGGELRHAFIIGLLAALTTVIVRFAWVFLVGGLGQLKASRGSVTEPLGKRGFTVLAWSGMRGVVSLAVALALPLVRDDGSPFPFREELVFAAFVAIVTTLLVQGLSLGPLIRRLGLAAEADGEALVRIRRAALESAERRLHALEARADPAVLAEARRIVEARAGRIGRSPALRDENDLALEELLREVVLAQRITLDELRAEGSVPDELLRRVERELDLDELRL